MDTYDLFQKLSAGAKFKEKALSTKSEVTDLRSGAFGRVVDQDQVPKFNPTHNHG